MTIPHREHTVNKAVSPGKFNHMALKWKIKLHVVSVSRKNKTLESTLLFN